MFDPLLLRRVEFRTVDVDPPMASLSGLWRKKEEKKEEKKVRIHFITDNFKRLTFDVEDDDCIRLHSGEALVIQGKEGNVKKKILASDDTGGYKVHRFWHHESHTPQDFAQIGRAHV